MTDDEAELIERGREELIPVLGSNPQPQNNEPDSQH